MPRFEDLTQLHSRRTFLQGMALAPLLFRAASLHGLRARLEPAKILADPASVPGITDFRLRPNYPAKSPLDDVLRLVAPGSDEYVTEKYAFEIEAILNEWSRAIKASDQSGAGLQGDWRRASPERVGDEVAALPGVPDAPREAEGLRGTGLRRLEIGGFDDLP